MSDEIKHFFDHIAPTYHQKFTDKQPFLKYFFEQRLQLATQDIDFTNKIIFDIGAGTGHLYDLISKRASNFYYYGCDLSAKMLANSKIPDECKLIGSFNNVNWPKKQADLIFALGLTTYLNEKEIKDLVIFMEQKLHKNGIAIISFTNSESIEIKIKAALKRVGRLIGSKNKVFTQSFTINTFDPEAMGHTFESEKIILDRTQFLNPTIPLLQLFLPILAKKYSIWKGTKSRYIGQSNSCSTEYIAFFKNGKKYKPKPIK